ncbi:hypothetical protein [Aromatoleum evansii]|jgi:hypothetical protein|uniref:hypothetical protein n=1 Tax=Aromatoleum evansii TaxID=59406 RepID=UPI00145DD1FA|nr:hypothetical protein [Aromatoleum evansii]NMG28422.1 hypothetical protein [Aromatoleum evansii]
MGIGFKDFRKAPKLLGFASGPFESAVEAANAWIVEHSADVLNVETLTDTGGIGGISSTSQDGVRVWYRT